MTLDWLYLHGLIAKSRICPARHPDIANFVIRRINMMVYSGNVGEQLIVYVIRRNFR